MDDPDAAAEEPDLATTEMHPDCNAGTREIGELRCSIEAVIHART